MKRLISICSGQFGDIPFEKLCEIMHQIGYDGLEVAIHAHIDVEKICSSDGYFNWYNEILHKNQMKVTTLSAHLAGQCVGDHYEKRLDNFVPDQYKDKPEEIKKWATEEMIKTAYAAKRMGIKVVSCFLGSPIWAYWYSFPQTSSKMIEAGYEEIKEKWSPIFDEYDKCGVRLSLEVHPAEIAFDYYSTKKLFEVLEGRKTLGINFDPSHLLWQGIDPVIFIRDFSDQIYSVHMKDVKISRDPRAGLLGSHIDFGDSRRKWNFVSLGHGDIDFDGIIRQLNAIQYRGALAIEWEDSGMDRFFGAEEALTYLKRLNYEESQMAFDSMLKG